MKDYEIKRMSREYIELIINEPLESKYRLVESIYLRAYLTGFMSSLFNRTYVSKLERLSDGKVIIKIISYE